VGTICSSLVLFSPSLRDSVVLDPELSLLATPFWLVATGLDLFRLVFLVAVMVIVVSSNSEGPKKIIILILILVGPTEPGKRLEGPCQVKTGPLLTLDRPEHFQGKMAVLTPKLQIFKKIRQNSKHLTDFFENCLENNF
jgi:hypothetical protein